MLAMLALAYSCVAAAGENEPAAPPRRDLFGTRGQEAARRPAGEGVRGTVELSSGERVEGRLSLQQGLALELFDTEAKEWRELRLEELARLEARVRSEDLEKEWRWKEAGSDEKVYTGRAYPRRWLDHEATMKDGRRFRGHVRGAVLLLEETPREPDPGKPAAGTSPAKRRFVIKQYERGALGQTLEDLVYVKAVVIGERPAAGGSPREGTPPAPPSARGSSGG